jgi:drug/metabolite transporter (DMT)-like permease
MLGLGLTTPGNSQFLFQASHPMVALGAIWVFRERFNRWQWTGMLGIVTGLALFFSDEWAGALHAGGPHYLRAAGLMLLSALCWPGFALAQKQLLRSLSSTQITGFVYAVLAVLFLPAAKPSALLALDGAHWAAAGYSMMSTVTAYLAFAEAFDHWEASRVASICSVSPILTVLAVAWVHHLAPSFMAAERIAPLGWAGAVLIVSGSALSSLMRDRPAR